MLRCYTLMLIAVLIAIPTALGERKSEKERWLERAGDTKENYDMNIKPLVQGVTNGKKLVLYEGLPHQFYEEALLERELKDKKSVKLHGFPFYEKPIGPKEDDVKALSALCSSKKTFARYEGAHKCGGFHPDWLVEVTDGDRTYRVLICFGCMEARFYGPKNELWTYVDKEALSQFSKLLTPYQKNRPRDKSK